MKKKPNILFLMCDQLQGRIFEPECLCKTPNIDSLISNGMRFRNAYAPNAVCSPSRASLMTGLLPHNHGVLYVTHTVDSDQGCLREDKPHWAQQLVKNGYQTGYFGKWHVERSMELEKFGWQVNCAFHSKYMKEKVKEVLPQDEPKYLKAKYYNDSFGYNKKIFYGVVDTKPEQRPMGLAVNEALNFLDETCESNNPWCCFVSVTEPHDPFICGKEAYKLYDVNELELPPNFYDELNNRPNIYKKAARVWRDMTDREKKEAMACYYASITEIDSQFGKIIDKVRPQLDNTIVILTSDHGELLGAHGLYCKNFSAAEEVYNIPLIMAGAGIKKGAVTNARVGLHDVCPTLLELTGCEPINVPDSCSFAPVLCDYKNEEKNFQTGFAEYFGGRMYLTQRVIWDGSWKYVFNGFDFDELYNLDDDPYEMNNLIDYPEYDRVLRKMSAQMWETVKNTGDKSLYNSQYPILRVASYGPNIENNN